MRQIQTVCRPQHRSATPAATPTPGMLAAERRRGPVRVALLDRHPVTVEGLAQLLSAQQGVSVVGRFYRVNDALASLSRCEAHVLVVDPQVAGPDAIALLRLLQREYPNLAVLVLSDNTDYVSAALDAGAKGFLLKTAVLGEILSGILKAADGQTPVSRSLLPMLASEVRGGGRTRQRLSSRELQILEQVATGNTNAEIARNLFISEATVKTHLHRVFNKLSVPDRASAVATAISLGLLRGALR
ncbi:response regulator transcription factor [Allokutzneria sp. NRRL B-24872]|uniref:LuxR C-terminal-related transcriptional regulator n=1 Tax=Allokutzneria sp. NRRL B-24872 TaxID=1137961 RepID=UPI000A3D4BFE|nr:response regulator transcription factor [Allokutzneria sp. NRRL B-24872]